MSAPWNADELSRSFKARAVKADRYLLELREKIRRNDSYKVISDQTLAEFYVYDPLWERTFLATRELLLAELAEMKEADPNPPQAYDRGMFRDAYDNTLADLIKRLSV